MKDDPLLQLTVWIIIILMVITALFVSAFVLLPAAAVYGGWKLYQHTRPIPTYEPSPPKEEPELEIKDKHWGEHCMIYAGTGHGKTQALQALVVKFLHQEPSPALFIMDSMGSMLKKIERLQFWEHYDRIVILDPTDDRPPALNFFQLQGGSPAQQQALFFYLFKAIDQSLTQRQATMVSYLIALMQTIPRATLDTLRQVCESKQQLYSLDKLDPIARDFFTNQFYSKDALVNQTKAQIAARLYTIGRNPVFSKMFSAPENKFNPAQCMKERKVVLINTDRYNLGDEASAVFGRFIIAQCVSAALSRASIPERYRPYAFLICDEMKAYADEQIETILSDMRQFKLGFIGATQAPHQLPDGVQRELATNTTIKMLGAVDYSVAAKLSRDMRTTTDFIQSMQVHKDHTEFACFVRNLTPQATKIHIPLGLLEAQPTIDEITHQALRYINAERYGVSRTHEAPEEEASPASGEPPPSGEVPHSAPPPPDPSKPGTF